jgi:hypothetical protein
MAARNHGPTVQYLRDKRWISGEKFAPIADKRANPGHAVKFPACD